MSETPAGWYPAPDAADLLRFWDGEMWTDKARPAPSGQAGPSAGATGTPTLDVQESKDVQAALRDGERVEAGFSAGVIRKKYFVATGSRVLVLQREKYRDKTIHEYAYSYDQVETIGISKWGVFTITLDGRKFEASTQQSADFTEFVRHRMPRPGPADLSTLPTPSVKGTAAAASNPASSLADADEDSLAEQLGQLAQLHADGMLSDAEFSLAKAQTLGAEPKRPS